jgi:hypothetical protein
MAVLVALFSITPVSAQPIWLAPRGDLPGSGSAGVPDFMDAFQPTAPWMRALPRVNVFVMGERYADTGPDANLRVIFAFLRSHNVALALGLGVLPGQSGCGRGVEGMISRGNAGRIATRVKSLGGIVRFLAMDEPLFYGHQYDRSPAACRMPISKVADGVSDSVTQMEKIFPGIEIGDVEPLSAFPAASWHDQFERWVTEYQRATGKPLAFLQVELAWGEHWDVRLRPLQSSLRHARIPLGMMYNANEPQASDAQWISAAKANVVASESILKSRPDQAIFVSWTAHPSHLLPDSAPETLTYLVNWYLDRGG